MVDAAATMASAGEGTGSSTTLSDSLGSDGSMGLAAEVLGRHGSGSAESDGGDIPVRGRARSQSLALEDGEDLIIGDPDDMLGGDIMSGGESGGDVADTEEEPAPRTRSRSRSMRVERPNLEALQIGGSPGATGGLSVSLDASSGTDLGGGRERAGSGMVTPTGPAAAGLSYKTRHILSDLDGHLSATGHATHHQALDRARPDAPGLPRRESSSESEEEAAERILAEEERRSLAGEGAPPGAPGSSTAGGGSGRGGAGGSSDSREGTPAATGARTASKEGKKKKRGKGKKKGEKKDPEYDIMLKLLLLGDGGVGKTSLINRMSENKFSHTMMHTAGVDFTTQYMTVAGKRVKVQLWDTAGQERFHVITRAYYRGANGIILVYDASTQDDEEDSFKNVQYWMGNIKQHALPSVESILVANKIDLPRKVEKSRGREMAESYGIRFFETSAKSGKGVTEAFKAVVEDIVTRHAGEPQLSRSAGRVPVADSGNDGDGGKRCVVQ